MLKKVFPSLPLLLLPLLILGSCSLNYRDAQMAEEMEEAIPNIQMEGVSHSLVERGGLIMRVEAKKSESYEKTRKILLFEVRFREYDSQGELVSQGKADRVEYFTDSRNATISGNVEVISHREKGGIRTQHLFWDNEKRLLKGPEDGQTETFDEDGSRFVGRGFEADLKRIIITFTEAVEGDYAVSDR